ncbi:MAG TPA: GntR family transcriptional regulator [Rectinemataceae bacterium]|nr:GntR family transcriptional regulator [Rectinemataceae bacterium]
MNLKAIDVDLSTRVDRVADALRQAIFDGDLNPGDRLGEQVLSQRLGVSRNTVREALRILSTDGLTVHMPNKGVTVRSLSVAEVEDIFRARTVLEMEAARASLSCPQQALDVLSAAMDAYAAAALSGNDSSAAKAHVDFHVAMVAITGSDRLAGLERALMQDLQVLIVAIDKSSDDLPNEVEKHRKLLSLFSARDLRGTTRCLEEDLLHAKSFILRRAT